jgi:DNA-binding response OmpR family regulator
MEKKPGRRAALIGCSDEWMCRSLQSVFEERGYTATRVGSGKQALKLARRGSFDVIVLDEHIDELAAVEVCVALRDDPIFDHATPIVITSSAHATPKSRAAAYTAGAWEYSQQPLDVDGLFLKLGTFLRARDELAVAQTQRLVDPASGLYTPFGLEQVSEQLGARALRGHEPFACVAFSHQPADREVSNDRALGAQRGGFADVANVVRVQSRKSDIVAQTGEFRLAILAPDTDAAGARLLVERLQRELAAASKNTAIPRGVRLRAGFCAVADFAAANVDMKELVHRAESALDHAPASGEDFGVVSFDELPPA